MEESEKESTKINPVKTHTRLFPLKCSEEKERSLFTRGKCGRFAVDIILKERKVCCPLYGLPSQMIEMDFLFIISAAKGAHVYDASSFLYSQLSIDEYIFEIEKVRRSGQLENENHPALFIACALLNALLLPS